MLLVESYMQQDKLCSVEHGVCPQCRLLPIGGPVPTDQPPLSFRSSLPLLLLPSPLTSFPLFLLPGALYNQLGSGVLVKIYVGIRQKRGAKGAEGWIFGEGCGGAS